MSRPQRKKLGEALVEAGLIDELQLRSALADQKRWGNRLGKTLVKLGFVEEGPLMRQLSRLMGYPVAEIAGRGIDAEVLALIPSGVAEKYRCLPLFVDDDGASRYLYMGMEEPADLSTLDALQLRTGLEICPVLIGFAELDAGLRRHYAVGLDGDPASETDGFEIGGDRVGPDCLRHGDEVLDAEPVPAASADDVSVPPETPRAEFEPGDESIEIGSSPPPALPGGGVAEVPTRRILQALTQVLIDKGVLTRQELLAEVRALSQRQED